jgi:pyruvate/2-oxoglutarate dehydrogenase complex dihydrolipoamide acyltransferase (E2) component
MHRVRMPKLDHMAEDGVMLAWHKEVGDQVKKGDLLFEFESEKATEEVCAEESGMLLKVVAEIGATVPVSATVALIGAEGEEIPADIGEAPVKHESDEPRTPEASKKPEESPRKQKKTGQIRISPLARKMAREHNIDLEEVSQQFTGNVVKKEDIEAFIASRGAAKAAPSPVVQSFQAVAGGDTAIELKGIRKTMFDRMTKVASTYAATTTIQKADVTKLIELREALSRKWGEETKIRYIAFFAKAASVALAEFPILNSTVDEAAGVIRLIKAINLGIAVDSKKGLVVPVLHGISDLSLKDMAARTNEVVARAVNNKLSGVDFADGTFTITNAGPLGAYINTPMINLPQSAILGTCSINEEPAVVDGNIVARKLMFLTLTYDHRIIQGAEAVGFLKRIIGLLEDPILLL